MQNEVAQTLASLDMNTVYTFVGMGIITNLGIIGTIVAFVVKSIHKTTWLVAKYDSRSEKQDRDINASFQMIRELRDKLDETYVLVKEIKARETTNR